MQETRGPAELIRRWVQASDMRSMAEWRRFVRAAGLSMPQLGLLMLNALMASDYIVITVQVQYFALEGLKRLLETVHMMQQRFPLCRIQTLGLVLTFVEDRVTLSRLVQQQLRNYFGTLVCDSVIHKSTRLAEAPNAGESILTYAPHSKAASEYQTLAGELIARIETAESPA